MVVRLIHPCYVGGRCDVQCRLQTLLFLLIVATVATARACNITTDCAPSLPDGCLGARGCVAFVATILTGVQPADTHCIDGVCDSSRDCNGTSFFFAPHGIDASYGFLETKPSDTIGNSSHTGCVAMMALACMAYTRHANVAPTSLFPFGLGRSCGAIRYLTTILCHATDAALYCCGTMTVC